MSESPRSAQGAKLRDALVALREAAPEAAVRRPSGVAHLQYQAFSVATRRQLARTPTPEAIADYVCNALDRAGLDATESRKAVATALVRVGLGEDSANQNLAWDKALMRALLMDLVISRQMSPNEVDALVLVAEMRLRALSREAREKRPGLLGWMLSRRMQPKPAKTARTSTGIREAPRSIIGHSLKAIARFDFDRLAELPEEPSDATARAVTEYAFASVVRDRFGADPDPDQVKAVAQRVSRLTESPAVTAEQVESVILGEFGLARAGTENEDRTSEIMLLVLTRLVDELGLYEHELNSLLLRAEMAAEVRGCEVTPLSIDLRQ